MNMSTRKTNEKVDRKLNINVHRKPMMATREKNQAAPMILRENQNSFIAQITDIIAYTIHNFNCAVRSARPAVLHQRIVAFNTAIFYEYLSHKTSR